MNMTDAQWAEKFNAECSSKNKAFSRNQTCEWNSGDFDFNIEYDDPEDFRNYCYQSYSTYTICGSCEENRLDFLNFKEGTILVKRRLKQIEDSLKEKFPDFKI